MINPVRRRWQALPRFLGAAFLMLVVATCQGDGPTSGERGAPGSPSLDVTSSSSTNILVGAGDIGTCGNNNDEATAQLLDGIPGTVFAVGDNAYASGTAAEYACYDATWGRHKARTRPVPGDRDYKTAGAPSYFAYFGAAAGDPSKGYYSYDLGGWHIIALNSKLAVNAGSPQEQWLRADLAATTQECILAYWHHPRFFSNGTGVRSTFKPLWDALYLAGADVVINADERFYERFAPQTPDEVADPANGIREFIVGTGGGSSNGFGTIRPNSQVRNSGTYGVLKLTLAPGSYSWQFVPVAGTFTDQGTTACHGDLPPVADPGGPYLSEGSVTFDGGGSSDPQGDLPLTYAWTFGDGSTGTGVAPSHTYASEGVYTVTLQVTDATDRVSEPATTTATIANIAPTVNAGPDQVVAPGAPLALEFGFSDPGLDDAPWTYTVQWGDGGSSNGSASSQAPLVTETHTYATVGQYTVRVTVTDKDGGAGWDEVAVTVTLAQVFVGAGDIASCSETGDEATAALLDGIPGTVYTLGDDAYPDGTLAEFNDCYGPNWGRHKARTKPSPGNHEYQTAGAAGYFAYFGAAAGEPGKGYYSYDLGAWHILSLNSNASMAAGSPQGEWIRADLAASTKRCTLAYWHHPRFSSTSDHASDPRSENAWRLLYRSGAEIVLVGHSHKYERYGPQTPDAVPDPQYGIRQIIVGTGGESHQTPGPPIANVEIANGSTFGVLKLTLDVDTYSWQFIPEAGKTFTDAGSGVCHDAPPNQAPTANPGGPYSADADVAFTGSGSTDPEGDAPFAYAWTFGDGSTGTGVAPTHTYQTDGLYSVTLTVTDSRGAVSAPATTTASIANAAPTVQAGGDVTIPSGGTFSLQALFSDPGANDAPWAYSISWGDGSPPETGTALTQSNPILASHAFADGGPYTVQVTVTDKDGGSGTDELIVTVGSPTSFEVLVGAGDIGTCSNNNDEATAQLLDGIPGTVFTVGDNAYASGTAAEYACYNATWGRHKARTRPVPGDRDYKTTGASGYFDYFGAAAGDPSKGYYSYDLGAWHIIALNSRIAMNAGSTQEQWLRADLGATTQACVLAYWHNPRFFSNGTNIRASLKPLWDALYEAGADVILNADERFYERFAPQTPDGVANPNGIREFIVGTGGGSTNAFGTILPTSEVRNSGTYGVLKLTLASGSYAWEFVPIAGKTFTDQGAQSCH